MNKQSIPKAICGDYKRPVVIGNLEIPCFVLEDGTRVLTQYGFYTAIGRSGRPAKGRGAGFDKTPEFLSVAYIKPFVNKELASSKAIQFRLPTGQVAWGYDATLLPKVCDVYLEARDAGALSVAQKRFADVCDTVMRGLAHIGIIALVDEVTGYQEIRSRIALQEILEKFIAKELRPWIKTFPDEFYEQYFKLRNWQYKPISIKRPSIVGRDTNNIIYDRLAPGIRKELHKQTPRDEMGRLKSHLHRRLTDDIGHPKLREHIASVLTLMRASSTWRGFKRLLERSLPRYGDTYQLPFNDDE